jgi:hypothetical protein
MRLRGQQIAVITYTNAACDEITRRLDFEPLIAVSTIHSFVWGLIQGFNADIREWLRASLAADLVELADQQRKGRPGTKTAIERERSIDAKQKRLAALQSIKSFTYNPRGHTRTPIKRYRAVVRKERLPAASRMPALIFANSFGGTTPYVKFPGALPGIGLRSGPGHRKRFTSVTIIHDRSSSKPRCRLIGSDISTASAASRGARWVMGTRLTRISVAGAGEAETMTHGRSFTPSSRPRRCSSCQR